VTEDAAKPAETQSADRPGQEATLFAALGYIPLLFFLPLFIGPRDSFARFHGRQSLVMFVVVLVFQVFVWVSDLVLGRIMGSMFLLGFFFKSVAWIVHYPLGFIVAGAYTVAVVAGVVQAATGQYWRIPVIGAYAERIRI
jgi:uncharacterized membrane protein